MYISSYDTVILYFILDYIIFKYKLCEQYFVLCTIIDCCIRSKNDNIFIEKNSIAYHISLVSSPCTTMEAHTNTFLLKLRAKLLWNDHKDSEKHFQE